MNLVNDFTIVIGMVATVAGLAKTIHQGKITKLYLDLSL